MGLFRRQQTKVDLQVEKLVQLSVDHVEKFGETIALSRIVKNKANDKIKDATSQLERMAENGNTKYSWYANLSNYTIEIKLDEVTHLLNQDELDKFYRAAERYRKANEEQERRSNTEDKAN